MIIKDQIKVYKNQIEETQKTLISQLRFNYHIDLLFDLAVLYESYYADLKDSSINTILQGADRLYSLLIKIIEQKKFTPDKRNLKRIRRHLQGRLEKQVQYGRKNLILTQLFKLELDLLLLEEFNQIDQHDRSCKVELTIDGQLVTELVDPDERKRDVKTGLKYEHLISFYYRAARNEVEKLKGQGSFQPLGSNELDKLASENIKIWEIAGVSYLIHFGIESEFTWQGKNYDALLLIRILASFITYPQVRYGFLFEEFIKNGNSDWSVWRSIREEAAFNDGEFTGPLLFLAWDELISRIQSVFSDHYSIKTLETHLSFFSQSLLKYSTELNFFFTPILRLGNTATMFVRPLMLQNVWLPLITKLISVPGDKGESKRVTRATEGLESLFKSHGFSTICEYDLYEDDEKLTDIDLAAFKDNYLFLIELKMTSPKPRPGDYKSHINDAFKKARRQNSKAFDYLQQHWSTFKSEFDTKTEWEEITVLRLIVSSSFETDGRVFSESLKISKFELERYLCNDAYLLMSDDELGMENTSTLNFYPSDESITGAKLYSLIMENKLWSFLDKEVADIDLKRYLPTFDPKEFDIKL